MWVCVFREFPSTVTHAVVSYHDNFSIYLLLYMYPLIFSSDSINDHNFLAHNSQDEDTPLIAETSTHNSMVANERLLGPLPLKEKKHHQVTMEEITTKIDTNQHKKGTTDIIYMSQLRRSQFPIIQLCRKNHRAPRNHFRRHADIKHKGMFYMYNHV